MLLALARVVHTEFGCAAPRPLRRAVDRRNQRRVVDGIVLRLWWGLEQRGKAGDRARANTHLAELRIVSRGTRDLVELVVLVGHFTHPLEL